MKKASIFTLYLGIYIIVLFGLAILFTFINDAIQLAGFFGDIKLAEPVRSDMIDPWYKWGSRHYWYFWMCTLLFLLSLARIIMWCIWYWDRAVFNKK